MLETKTSDLREVSVAVKDIHSKDQMKTQNKAEAMILIQSNTTLEYNSCDGI